MYANLSSEPSKKTEGHCRPFPKSIFIFSFPLAHTPYFTSVLFRTSYSQLTDIESKARLRSHYLDNGIFLDRLRGDLGIVGASVQVVGQIVERRNRDALCHYDR